MRWLAGRRRLSRRSPAARSSAAARSRTSVRLVRGRGGGRTRLPARRVIVAGSLGPRVGRGRRARPRVRAWSPSRPDAARPPRRARLAGGARGPRPGRVVVAVVATAGATNNGAVTTSPPSPTVCAGARPLVARGRRLRRGRAAAPRACARLFAGIERADSFIVEPAQMALPAVQTAPRSCTATNAGAKARSRRRADYLDAHRRKRRRATRDLAVHLTRRARGLPLWASVLAYGTDAYAAAVEHCVGIAAFAAERIADAAALELVIEPAFTVLLLRRLGWETSTPRGVRTRSAAAWRW